MAVFAAVAFLAGFAVECSDVFSAQRAVLPDDGSVRIRSMKPRRLDEVRAVPFLSYQAIRSIKRECK